MKNELFDYIITTPSINQNSINISWHSKYNNSFLELSIDGDMKFINKKVYKPIVEEFEKEDDLLIGFDKRYINRLTITNLKNNTKYIYRISVNNQYSDIHSFITPNKKESFSFSALTDFQCFNNDLTHKLIKQMKEKIDTKLFVCSGDLVDVAGDEKEWEWVFKDDSFNDLVFAATCGDHEYWKTDLPHVLHFTRPNTFNAIFNNPKNGIKEALNTNYYFYYNNVLFVFIDMSDSNTSYGLLFEKQIEWFKETLNNLKGTYDYLIVLNHKSIYGSKEIDPAVRKNITNLFSPIVDEYHVDLVISGHDHIYSRTYPIFNGEKSEKGTYYLDLGSSGNKYRIPTIDLYEDNLHEKVINLKEKQYALSALIKVTKNKMIIEVYNSNNELVDNFIINNKTI